MVSALGIGWASQRFQNRDAPDISKALRLPIRAQNKTMPALATVAVEMRGSSMRSVMEAMRREERWNTLSDYAIRRRSKLGLPVLETFPFQLGNFTEEAQYFLVLGDCLANRALQRLGNAQLACLAVMALHKIQGRVAFAVGTMAIWLATLAGALGERTAQEPLAGSELRNARAETAFGSGEFGTTEGTAHVLYAYYIRFAKKARAKTQCEYARASPQGQTSSKQQSFQIFWQAREFGYGIAAD